MCEQIINEINEFINNNKDITVGDVNNKLINKLRVTHSTQDIQTTARYYLELLSTPTHKSPVKERAVKIIRALNYSLQFSE